MSAKKHAATVEYDEVSADYLDKRQLRKVAYFVIYSRHHLVAKSPDEEFAAISRAESELDTD